MVDCIAPAVNNEQIQRIEDMFGLHDQAPVVCESFRQWVLEDNFVNGRPALEKVGVQFVDDVAPYELMKLRVLNGGHAALAYPAGLMGIEFVHEAMQNETITRYLEKLIVDEVIPSLPEVAGIDVQDYLKIIKQRFSNPEVKDTIERLYQDGQNRLPKFILPIIVDNIECSRTIKGLSLVIALWCKLCKSAGSPQANINLHDNLAPVLTNKALQANSSHTVFIGMTDVFGGLGSNELFGTLFKQWLNLLDKKGVEATLESYINMK
jgi:mannitol 2-dehydrogenase